MVKFKVIFELLFVVVVAMAVAPHVEGMKQRGKTITLTLDDHFYLKERKILLGPGVGFENGENVIFIKESNYPYERKIYKNNGYKHLKIDNRFMWEKIDGWLKITNPHYRPPGSGAKEPEDSGKRIGDEREATVVCSPGSGGGLRKREAVVAKSFGCIPKEFVVAVAFAVVTAASAVSAVNYGL